MNVTIHLEYPRYCTGCLLAVVSIEGKWYCRKCYWSAYDNARKPVFVEPFQHILRPDQCVKENGE